MMDDSTLRQWFGVQAPEATQKGNAKALSARALLARLDGAEREDLLRAMKSGDLETIRAIMARHQGGAAVRVDANRECLEPPTPMMRPRGWHGSTRRPRAASSERER